MSKPLGAGRPLPASGLEVEHLASVAGRVAAGLGVSLVPELALFQFRLPESVAVPADEPHLERPILIIRGKGLNLSVAARALLELIEKRAEPAASEQRG